MKKVKEFVISSIVFILLVYLTVGVHHLAELI